MGQIINRRRSLPIPIGLIRTSSPEHRGGGGGKRDLDLRYLAAVSTFVSLFSSRFFVKAVRSVWDFGLGIGIGKKNEHTKSREICIII